MAVDVLVTGATGALGRQIVQILRSSNYQVVACGRTAGPEADVSWDISSQDGPEPDCHPAVVVHAAAQVGRYGQFLPTALPLFDVNVTGTMRVVRWCAARGVERLVFISGAIVYGRWLDSPKSEGDPVEPWLAGPYAVSKWCGEGVASLLTCNGGRVCILRLTSLYGSRYDSGLIPRLLRQGQQTGCIGLEPPFDDAFDLLHVSDAARTVCHAIEKGQSGLCNVGSGGLVTIRELAALCASQVNAQLTLSAAKPNRPNRIINWVDDSKARDELNHANGITLRQGIAEIARSLPGTGPEARAPGASGQR